MASSASGSRLMARLKSMAVVTIGGGTIFTFYSIYSNNEYAYHNYIMPVFHKLFEPERAHNIAVFANRYKLFPKSTFQDPDNLKISVFNQIFSNPVGLAAGFDKNGVAIEGVHNLGFGFIEIGSVTPLPQDGNPKPRLFRLEEDKAIINRYGFNNEGHAAILARLEEVKTSNPDLIIGVNLGVNKLSADPIVDYVSGIEKFGLLANYLVVNVSSPNTEGLRSLQSAISLEQVINSCLVARNALPNRPPLLVKLAPDLSQGELEDIASILDRRDRRIDGIIICNTTVHRPVTLLNALHKDQEGGLSGPPLKQIATDMVSIMYKLTKGRIPIIGVGGISSGQDAYDKIKAGASLVQLYTSMVYEGPPIVTKIKRELQELLEQDGFKDVQAAIGINHKHSI